MQIDSFIDKTAHIQNAQRALYGPRYGYEYFNKGPLLEIRKYLDEKRHMGLLNQVEIMAATIGNYYRFCIYSVSPKIWNQVFLPALQGYAPDIQVQLYPDDPNAPSVNVYLWVKL